MPEIGVLPIMRIDMTGRVCGCLTVIRKYDVYRTNDTRWLCKCSCGNEAIVRGSYLRNGHTTSCGKCQKYIFENGYVRCEVRSGRSFLINAADYPIIRDYKWSVDRNGYVMTRGPDGHSVKLHRLLTCAKKGEVVDHINGEPSDCRRENMRITTQHKNTYNSRLPKNTTTGYKGVCFDKSKSRYMAHIHPDGKMVFLGYYDNPKQAAMAYDNAACFYYGEYARLNFPRKEENK